MAAGLAAAEKSGGVSCAQAGGKTGGISCAKATRKDDDDDDDDGDDDEMTMRFLCLLFVAETHFAQLVI